MYVSGIPAINKRCLTVVVFFCFTRECISLSSGGCDLELHSSDMCDGRSESSAAGEALLEFELVAKS